MEYSDMSNAQLKRIAAGLRNEYAKLGDDYKTARTERERRLIRAELDRVGDELYDVEYELTRRKQVRRQRQEDTEFEELPNEKDEFVDVGGEMRARLRDPRTGRFVSSR